jgi:hypothetical protein
MLMSAAMSLSLSTAIFLNHNIIIASHVSNHIISHVNSHISFLGLMVTFIFITDIVPRLGCEG